MSRQTRKSAKAKRPTGLIDVFFEEYEGQHAENGLAAMLAEWDRIDANSEFDPKRQAAMRKAIFEELQELQSSQKHFIDDMKE